MDIFLAGEAESCLRFSIFPSDWADQLSWLLALQTQREDFRFGLRERYKHEVKMSFAVTECHYPTDIIGKKDKNTGNLPFFFFPDSILFSIFFPLKSKDKHQACLGISALQVHCSGL